MNIDYERAEIYNSFGRLAVREGFVPPLILALERSRETYADIAAESRRNEIAAETEYSEA